MEEGLSRSGLVQMSSLPGSQNAPRSIYYGISASRFLEPLDQLDALLLISRLKRSGLDMGLTVFVAGRYAVLNGRENGPLIRAERAKIDIMRAASSVIDPSVGLTLLKTDDLWYSPLYWEQVGKLRSRPGIISSERKGKVFSTVAAGFEPGIISAIGPGLLDALSPLDAPSLYRLFEVAEAAYLGEQKGIESKIGPASEEEYDRFIGSFMGLVQLRQPLDLRSIGGKAKPITPYIGKEGEERIFLESDKDEIARKIMKAAQRQAGAPLFFDGFMNPFLRLSVLAIEAAAAADSVPIRLNGSAVSDGAGVIESFSRSGTAGLSRIAPLISECLWAYMIRPIQMRMRILQDRSPLPAGIPSQGMDAIQGGASP